MTESMMREQIKIIIGRYNKKGDNMNENKMNINWEITTYGKLPRKAYK